MRSPDDDEIFEAPSESEPDDDEGTLAPPAKAKRRRGRKAEPTAMVAVMKEAFTPMAGPNSHKKIKPGPDDPPMHLDRLRDYVHGVSAEADTAKFARELLHTCGPLVLDGVQYRLLGDVATGTIEAESVEILNLRRQSAIRGVEPEKNPFAA